MLLLQCFFLSLIFFQKLQRQPESVAADKYCEEGGDGERKPRVKDLPWDQLENLGSDHFWCCLVLSLLVHLLLPGLLLKEAPHDGDGGDDADDYCLGEDDPCSVLHPFNSGGWSLDAISSLINHYTALFSDLYYWFGEQWSTPGQSENRKR